MTAIMLERATPFLYLSIPTAAAVPRTVAIAEDETARIIVFEKALRVASSSKSLLYH